MQMSAKSLGQEYGLTAAEMNRVLVKEGFLKGTPGDYSITEKALKYAVEKDFHRGTGGYACYNRYWTTRTFDDSIKEELRVTPDLVKDIRNEMAKERAARYASQAAARAQANANFLANQTAKKVAQEKAERMTLETERFVTNWRRKGKVGLVVGGIVIGSYGFYKVYPKVKCWWKESCVKNKKKVVVRKTSEDAIVSPEWIKTTSTEELKLEQRKLNMRLAWREKVGDEIDENLMSVYEAIKKELQYRNEMN